MIRIRIALLAVLLALSMPAWAGFGLGPIQTYSNSNQWRADVVLVEDINKDGLDDVVMVYQAWQPPNLAGLAVFTQDPVTHALMGPATYPIELEARSNAAYSIQSVDVDGDGDDEVVIGHAFGFSVLSPADGFAIVATGRPLEPDPLGGPPIAEAADFTGDGKQDIVFLWGGIAPVKRQVSLFAGDGSGHFSAAQSALVFPDACCFIDMRPLDFNGDGRIDLVMLKAPVYGQGDPSDFGFRGYANGGNGSFLAMPQLTLRYQASFGMDVADIDGDGFPDLIGSLRRQPPYSFVNGAIAFLHGRLGRTYVASRRWAGISGGATAAVKAGDIDGDGKLDLMFSEYLAGIDPCYLGVAPGANKTVLRFHMGQVCANGFDSIAIGDINGDGLQDVVLAGQSAGLGWALGTTTQSIVNLVVGEGFSTNTAAFNLTNASTSATIAAPSVEVVYSVNRGKIDLTDWPQECSRPDPQVLRIVCHFPDLPAGQSASGVVHYTVLQSQPYMQLHATAKATTSTEETVTSDNTITAATWIRQL